MVLRMLYASVISRPSVVLTGLSCRSVTSPGKSPSFRSGRFPARICGMACSFSSFVSFLPAPPAAASNLTEVSKVTITCLPESARPEGSSVPLVKASVTVCSSAAKVSFPTLLPSIASP